MYLTDTHCHLDFNSFDSDRQQVLERAWQAGIQRILNPGIDLQTSQTALELSENHPFVFAAVGVHPTSASGWDSSLLPALRKLAQHPKVVAIGEIGLDYYWDKTPVPDQKQALRDQLALAAELCLPVVVHNREATEDILAILLAWQSELESKGSPLAARPGVLHSFSGNSEHALRAAAAHFYIGITGPVTFKNAPELQKGVQETPLEHLLIETDAPFLAPHPMRGKRNEPAYVRHVAEKIALLKGCTIDDVASQTARNARHLFGWSGEV